MALALEPKETGTSRRTKCLLFSACANISSLSEIDLQDYGLLPLLVCLPFVAMHAGVSRTGLEANLPSVPPDVFSAPATIPCVILRTNMGAIRLRSNNSRVRRRSHLRLLPLRFGVRVVTEVL
jgi:hypothetical protein